MLRIDLDAAGVPYVVQGPDGPLFADFHALRHSYITLLELSGVSPKHAQVLARHSDIRLTMDRYTHARLADLGASVARLALPVGPTGEVNPLARLSRADLENLTTGLLALLGVLVAPRVAPSGWTNGDTLGRSGTKKSA